MSAERAPDRLRRIYNIRNYQWFAISTALMLFPALCAVLLLNRVGSAADLGLYSYAYALTAPLQAFLGLHARAFIAMDRLYGHPVEDLVAQRVHMGLSMTLVLLAIGGFQGFATPAVLTLLAMGLLRLAEGTSEVSVGVMQREHRPRMMAAAYGMRALVSVSSFTGVYLLSRSLFLATLLAACLSLTSFLSFDRYLLKRLGKPLDMGVARASLLSKRPFQLSLCLLPAAFLNAISVLEGNVPRYVVEASVGLSELGIFASLGFFLSIPTNIVHPIFFMTIAPIGQLVKQADAAANRRIRRMVLLNVGITIFFGGVLLACCMLLGSPTLGLLAPRLRPHADLLVVMAVGAALGLLRSCAGFILTALNVLKTQSVLSVANGLTFLAIAHTVAHGSLSRVAWSWAASTALTALASMALVWRRVWSRPTVSAPIASAASEEVVT